MFVCAANEIVPESALAAVAEETSASDAASANGGGSGSGGREKAAGEGGEGQSSSGSGRSERERSRSEMAISSRPITLKCRVQFASDVPVSFSRQIRFEDGVGNSAELTVTATADNSLFTCYPFIAKHRDDFRIVCEQVEHM